MESKKLTDAEKLITLHNAIKNLEGVEIQYNIIKQHLIPLREYLDELEKINYDTDKW